MCAELFTMATDRASRNPRIEVRVGLAVGLQLFDRMGDPIDGTLASG